MLDDVLDDMLDDAPRGHNLHLFLQLQPRDNRYEQQKGRCETPVPGSMHNEASPSSVSCLLAAVTVSESVSH